MSGRRANPLSSLQRTALTADPIHIQFSRFSAFYTPLIATIAGGFPKDEGFEPRHSVAPPGKPAIEGLVAPAASRQNATSRTRG